MGFSPCLQIQSNPSSSRTFPVFWFNFSNSGRWRSRLVLLPAPPSAHTPSKSLSEPLESDVIPKIKEVNHSDGYDNEKEEKRRKRKPRPSFHDVTTQRWSQYNPSQRQSFPWQTQSRDSSTFPSPPPLPSPSPPPFHDLGNEDIHNLNILNSGDEPHPLPEVKFGEDSYGTHNLNSLNSGDEDEPHPRPEVEFGEEPSSNYASVEASPSPENQTTPCKEEKADSHLQETFIPRERTRQVQTAVVPKPLSGKPKPIDLESSVLDSHSSNVTAFVESIPILSDHSIAEPTASLPWQRERAMTTDTRDQNQKRLPRKGSHTELAERILPELELQRLRDAALRMKERMKVGPAGVTEAVVQAIHNKWKEEEVVKLRFEGPPSLHMTRTHQILESKTGGLVIWRSGRSVVLYRGMGNEFPCVRSYAASKSVVRDQNPDSVLLPDKKPSFRGCDWSRESTSAVTESFLDELGPRYKDWSGWDPIPVDADLLPGRVPGYKPPYRMLPFKIRSKLRDAEMTALRRLARSIAPHFALGRNREHQGLAAAIVKLWEKSAIAKIAIKRSVPSTSNEIMAEEIRKLTGGTLLSRNKEYLVFYRGNDFLSPSVRATLEEKQHQAVIRQENEELSRQKALDLLSSDSRPAKGRLVAGTLAETTEAAARWGKNQNMISEEEKEAMRRDFAVSKHASLVRVFERKLYLTKVKLAKAERALAKVQQTLIPADLPTDLETVTDEERARFRSIGLKSNSFLLLGRRDVFDGTVQNIHLNWKNKELVKVLVTKRKSFDQVKHIAISLEAESGGVLISLDKTTKGYAIILYRGKNYHRPRILRPVHLLDRRKALERSIELQRREALKHHMWKLQGKIRTMKAQLEQMMAGAKTKGKDLLQESDAFLSDESDDDFDEEGEEAYLKTYDSEDEDSEDHDSESYGNEMI